MYAAILAGGVGSRLWPSSRTTRPKQFSDITGNGRTMIQATVDRLGDLVTGENLYVLTGERYVHLATEQLPTMPKGNVIAEPSGRNTAPAIGLACLHMRRRDPEAIVAVLPADHIITNALNLREVMRRGVQAAHEGHLVTLGIEPTEPHTGYGYIKRDQQVMQKTGIAIPVYTVAQFLEKPNYTKATEFVESGSYYWNGGIYIFSVSTMLHEIERQNPKMHELLHQIDERMDEGEPYVDLWEQMPDISIDHAVAEGAERVAVVPLDAGWNDVGSWDALDGVLAANHDGNRIAKGDVISVQSEGNIVLMEEEPARRRLVALVGVEDLVVVDTGDALLIGDKQHMQQVKQVVSRLREDARSELL